MKSSMERQNWRIFAGLGICVALIAITSLHYGTSHHSHQPHQIYRRLYYLPILAAAFTWGWKGGLGTAVITCLVYLPHAFLMEHGSPAPAVDKALEMALYLVVGGLTGVLVDRQQRVNKDLRNSLEKLEKTQDELVESERMATLGRVSAGLSHEIRTPLASIQGSAELLGEALGENHEQSELAEILSQETKRLNHIVTSFLDYARPPTPNLESLLICTFLDSQLTLLRAGAPDGVELEKTCDCELEIQGDSDQMASLVQNLVRNACQAMEERGGTVEVRATADEHGARLEVLDNGPGMDDETKKQAMLPFVTQRQGGTGLGLALCSSIAQAHGGHIELLDGPGGRGLHVVVHLPGGVS